MKRQVMIVILCCYFSLSYVFAQGYKFFNGKDWKKFDSYNLSSKEEKEIKEMFLKATYEATIFSGKPLISIRNEEFLTYVEFLDRFYKRKKNEVIPLYHSLKIVDMVKKGRPNIEIQRYVIAVLTKLRQLKLIK